MGLKSHYVLGFNGSHDGSVALVKDGKLVGTATKERFTRKKKDGNGNDEEVVQHLLGRFDLGLEDIDAIAFCDNYSNIECNYLRCEDLDGVLRPRSNIYGSLKEECVFVKEFQELQTRVKSKIIPTYHINHHLGHAAYVFYTSNFERAICFTLDGSPAENSMIAVADDLKITRYQMPPLNISILYDWFTYYLLGNPIFKSGSVMGLAAYGQVSTSLDYKNFQGLDYEDYWRTLAKREPAKKRKDCTNVSQSDMDVAASLQEIFEKSVLDYLMQLPQDIVDSTEGHLCLSGGSFLNCKVNGLINKEGRFNKVHISPACGDDGLSAGAALYCAHNILKMPRVSYRTEDLIFSGAHYPPLSTGESYDVAWVAKQIAQGKVVGFFQGASEFGPRALGNRSILADPRNNEMRDYLNSKIKHREWFRPFGASVLFENSSEWFDFAEESPFMLYAARVKRPDLIPAVTHVDGTSRIQTLKREVNPRYFDLIKSFKDLTGVPLLLNTSLNDNDEPIVETPDDAIRLFARIPLDLLVIEDRVFVR